MIEPGNVLATLVTAILSAVTGVGGTAWWIQWRKDRREETVSRVDVVQKLWTIVTELQIQQVRTFDAGQAARAEAEAAHVEAGEARDEALAARAEVGQIRRLFARLVRPLVDWIDAGALPPPPVVPPELRALLEDVEHEHPKETP